MLVKWNKMSVMVIFFITYYTHSIIRVTVLHRVTLVSLSKKYTSNTYLAQENGVCFVCGYGSIFSLSYSLLVIRVKG